MTPEQEKQALEAFLIDKQFAADWTAQMLEWRKDEISYDWRLWCRSWEARGRASGQQGVEGYCWMPKELTAENGAKAALIGEFEEEHQGSRLIHVQISWTTIKEIYKAAVAHFAASPQITSPAEKPNGESIAKALKTWEASKEGIECSIGTACGTYLRNRLATAFIAGASAQPSGSVQEPVLYMSRDGDTCTSELWKVADSRTRDWYCRRLYELPEPPGGT